MKHASILLSMALLFTANVASAADAPSGCSETVRCVAPKLAHFDTTGHSLVVEFTKTGETTTGVLDDLTVVKETSTRILKRLASVPCKAVTTRPDPDSTQAVMECEDPTVIDTGYTLELLGKDFAGIQYARVTQNRYLGPIVLATLPCQ